MRFLFILPKCMTLGGLILIAAGFFGHYSAYADLAAHFAVYYFLLFTALTFIFALTRKWPWALTAILGVTLSIMPPMFAYAPRPPVPQNTGTELTLLQFNANYANPTPEKILAWITSLTTQALKEPVPPPDIILLQEMSPYMAKALAPLLDKHNTMYPYKIVAYRPGAFGMAILSRYPLGDIQRASFSPSAPEHTIATVTLVDGQLLRLYETHTLPPLSSAYSYVRNNELIQLADIIATDQEPHKILLGDFNITPYSAWFRDIESRSGLHSTMRGLGLHSLSDGTWPAFLPALFRIPIDHLLISAHIRVINRYVGPDLGSDHLPVLTVLRFPPRPE